MVQFITTQSFARFATEGFNEKMAFGSNYFANKDSLFKPKTKFTTT